MELQRKEIIGLHEGVIAHLNRAMIGAQFPEKYIESHGGRALAGQFVCQPAINVPRPVKSRPVTQLNISANKINTGLIDEYTSEISSDRGGKLRCLPHSHIVGHPLEALEEIEAKHSHGADKHYYTAGD